MRMKGAFFFVISCVFNFHAGAQVKNDTIIKFYKMNHTDIKIRDYDKKFMTRAIQLSQESVNKGDAAFGSLITIDDKLLVEGLNDYKTKISEHAEIVALNKAHKLLGTYDLSACTLYTSCEPCPMCSFMIREFKIKRVVFALPSMYMGGYSKWPILQDKDLGTLKPIFSDPPEVIGGFMEEEAKAVMDQTRLWMFGAQPTTKK